MLLYIHFQMKALKLKTGKLIEHQLLISDVDIVNWLKFLNK